MDKDMVQKLSHLLGLTYSELAEKSGYSIETVKAYMCGARRPSKKMDEFFKAALKEKLQSGDDTLKFVKDALD